MRSEAAPVAVAPANLAEFFRTPRQSLSVRLCPSLSSSRCAHLLRWECPFCAARLILTPTPVTGPPHNPHFPTPRNLTAGRGGAMIQPVSHPGPQGPPDGRPDP